MISKKSKENTWKTILSNIRSLSEISNTGVFLTKRLIGQISRPSFPRCWKDFFSLYGNWTSVLVNHQVAAELQVSRACLETLPSLFQVFRKHGE